MATARGGKQTVELAVSYTALPEYKRRAYTSTWGSMMLDALAEVLKDDPKRLEAINGPVDECLRKHRSHHDSSAALFSMEGGKRQGIEPTRGVHTGRAGDDDPTDSLFSKYG